MKIKWQLHRLHHKQSNVNDPSALAVRAHDSISYLRPNVELDLGLGWGKYFKKRHWHVDFSATYDLQIFWNQNMMRSFPIIDNPLFALWPGNLYLYGLTLNGRLDF